MKATSRGIALIKSYEKCRLKAYDDSTGVWTIGWGNTFYEDGDKVKPGDVITQARADYLFQFILADFEKRVYGLLKVAVTPSQFDALVSFAYNVGTSAKGLGGSTLLKKVNKDPFDPTIEKEFLKWNKAGGKVLNGLTKRRQAEADLYFSE